MSSSTNHTDSAPRPTRAAGTLRITFLLLLMSVMLFGLVVVPFTYVANELVQPSVCFLSSTRAFPLPPLARALQEHQVWAMTWPPTLPGERCRTMRRARCRLTHPALCRSDVRETRRLSSPLRTPRRWVSAPKTMKTTSIKLCRKTRRSHIGSSRP